MDSDLDMHCQTTESGELYTEVSLPSGKLYFGKDAKVSIFSFLRHASGSVINSLELANKFENARFIKVPANPKIEILQSYDVHYENNFQTMPMIINWLKSLPFENRQMFLNFDKLISPESVEFARELTAHVRMVFLDMELTRDICIIGAKYKALSDSDRKILENISPDSAAMFKIIAEKTSFNNKK
jgi:hypothetical protein